MFKPIETFEPVTVWIYYDPVLQNITGTAKEWAVVNKHSPFCFLFDNLLREYPRILTRFPPEAGLLGFTLNNRPPQMDTPLDEGDEIRFGIYPPTPNASRMLS